MQRFGKAWVEIAKFMPNKTQLQCRTHGQKYLKSLESLVTIIGYYLREKKFEKEHHYFKIRKYEDQTNKLKEVYLEGKYGSYQINWELFPEFLSEENANDDLSQMTFEDKIRDIKAAAQREL